MEKLEKLISDNNLVQVFKLIRDFDKFLEKRYIYFVVNNFLERILQWHFEIWQKKNEWKNKNIREASGFDELLRELTFTIQRIEERVLKENKSWYFFNNLKKHVIY